MSPAFGARRPGGTPARVALAVVVAIVVVISVVTSRGSSFDSKGSGEHLIRDYVVKFGNGAKLTSVTCPSGVAQKLGRSYDCNVTLRNSATGQTARGTITIHMVSGNKVAINGAPDVHLH